MSTIQPASPTSGNEKSQVPSELRKWLAQYWPVLISVGSVIVTLNQVAWSILQQEVGPKLYVLLAITVLVLTVVRFRRARNFVTWLILPPPKPKPQGLTFLGPRPYQKEDRDRFSGRQRETEQCIQLLKERSFVVVEGESGCGKSSLLRSAVLPEFESETRVISFRLRDASYTDKSPSDLLRETVGKVKPSARPRRTLATAIAAAADAAGPLLIFLDQFEELFTVRDQERHKFWETLHSAIEDGHIRLVLTIRSDFCDLLGDLCRQVDPEGRTFDLRSWFQLRAFDESQATHVIAEMLKHFHEGNPIQKQRVDDLASEIARDLLRPPRDKRVSHQDQPTVLPVELQIVGLMLERHGLEGITANRYRQLGGKQHLIREYIKEAKDSVFRHTRLGDAESSRVLGALISPAGTKQVRTPSSIDQQLALPSGKAAAVLDTFADRYLVHRLPAEQGEAQYELLHDHLITLLDESGDKQFRKAQDARERLSFWWQRSRVSDDPSADTSILSRFRRFIAQPVPIGEVIALWRYAEGNDQRRLLWKSVRALAIRTTLAIAMICGLLYLMLLPVLEQHRLALAKAQERSNFKIAENKLRAAESQLIVDLDKVEQLLKEAENLINNGNTLIFPRWTDLNEEHSALTLAKDLEATRLYFATWSNGAYDCSSAIGQYNEHLKHLDLSNPALEKVIEKIEKSGQKERIVNALDDLAYLYERQREREIKKVALAKKFKKKRDTMLKLANVLDPVKEHKEFRSWLKNQTGKPGDEVNLLKLVKDNFEDTEDFERAKPELLVLIGKLLESDPKEQEQFWRKSVTVHPTDFWLNVELGQFLMKKTIREAIKKANRDWLPFAETHPVTYLLLNEYTEQGKIAMCEKTAAEAAGFFRAALVSRPDEPSVYLDLSTALLLVRQNDDAFGYCKRAVEIAGEGIKAEAIDHLGIVTLLRDPGGLATALTYFDKAAGENAALPRLHYVLTVLPHSPNSDRIYPKLRELVNIWKRHVEAENELFEEGRFEQKRVMLDRKSVRHVLEKLMDNRDLQKATEATANGESEWEELPKRMGDLIKKLRKY